MSLRFRCNTGVRAYTAKMHSYSLQMCGAGSGGRSIAEKNGDVNGSY